MITRPFSLKKSQKEKITLIPFYSSLVAKDLYLKITVGNLTILVKYNVFTLSRYAVYSLLNMYYKFISRHNVWLIVFFYAETSFLQSILWNNLNSWGPIFVVFYFFEGMKYH